ncbi:MAG: fatty acid desaturase [Limisphaerales bacterium]
MRQTPELCEEANDLEADVTLNQSELKELRNALPKEAFEPAPKKLITLFIHAALVVGGFCFAGHTNTAVALILSGVIAGHSLAAIGFLSHELTHGVIIRNKYLLFLAEKFFWGIALVSPTMWRRAHNQTHHPYLNTPKDCDRRFLETEKTGFRQWYVFLIYPNAEMFPWNPLIWVYMNVYFLRNMIAVFLDRRKNIAIAPATPCYRKGDGKRVMLDMAFILVILCFLFFVGRFSFIRFTEMLIVSQLAASIIVMTYIFTNHMLNPVTKEIDVISSSTSVIVPAWLDWLHAHYSYHTEHHVFPTLNSDYYPQLSLLLQQRFPGKYNRIPIGKAWRQLWKTPSFSNIK